MKREPKEKTAIFLSKLIKILIRISIVLLIVGLISLVACAIIVSATGSKIKVGDGEIKAFDYVLKYEATEDNTIKLEYKDKSYEMDYLDDLFEDFSAQKVVDYVDGISVNKIVWIFELVIINAIVVLVLTIMYLKQFIKVLKNIIKEHTPFNKENSTHLVYAARLMLLIFLFNVLFQIIIEGLSNDVVSINVNLSGLQTAAIVYIIAWGINVHNKKKLFEE